MEPAKGIVLFLHPEEHALLLDTVISALGRYQVELFQARDPVLRASLDQRRQLMESILKKLLTLGRSTESKQAHVEGESEIAMKEKAA